MVRITLVDGIDRAVARRNIHPPPGGVVEQIICVAANIDMGHELTRSGIKHDHPRRLAATDEEPMAFFVQVDRIVSLGARQRPRVKQRPAFPIDHRDLFQSRYVGKDPPSFLLDDEALWLTGQLDFAQYLSIGNTEDRDSDFVRSEEHTS